MDTRRRIGPWLTREILGEGGNAIVYRAARDGDAQEFAVKVLQAKRVQSEPYRRFVREVQVLQNLGGFQGVLPLLDAYLPDRPTSSDPAWLSMPVATPIADALAGKPLDLVVEAIAAIADTLARLARRGISHRDVKPGNLYVYREDWIVGDFGLVALPDAESITNSERRLGPEHYTAYEMVINPAGADPKPADVYSLGKTLWVLATGEKFPPGGHQRSDERDLQIARFRTDTRAELLDRTIDRTTLLRPDGRPTMESVARDLRAWLRLPSRPAEATRTIDVEALVEPFKKKLQTEIDAETSEQERVRMGMRVARELEALSAPLDAALRRLDSRAQIGRADHNLGAALHVPDTLGSERRIHSDEHVSSIVSGPRYFPFAVSYGWGLDLYESGVVAIQTVVFVGHEEVLGSDFWWAGDRRRAEVGSVELATILRQSVDEMSRELQKALRIYESKL